MHLGLRELRAFFDRARSDNALVLATVVATRGSTYRKPGAMMLIRDNAEFAGLISGGCLEGDLVEHANAVFDDGRPRQVTYDLSGEEDALWSLGLGCGGVVKLLLQRLDRAGDFGFLPTLFASLERRRDCVLALVREAVGEMEAGAFALAGAAGEFCGDERLGDCLDGMPGAWRQPQRYHYVDAPGATRQDQVLLVHLAPPPRILVCGAGPDAVPVAKQVDSLGWECVVVDHRPAHARPERFPLSSRVLLAQPRELGRAVDLGEVDAAVVMSHNLDHDTVYLEQLAGRGLAYLGLLGPRARRLELQEKLAIGEGVIRGPAGLDIGAELPESIALSILAEIHQVLNAASPRQGT
jgi:xanthine dehydrogenase accessory factor